MTEHELSGLEYQKIIELFGRARSQLAPQDVVLIAGATGTQPLADPGPMKSRVYVIAARVLELSVDSKRVKTRNVHKYYEDGGSVPFSGEEWTDVGYFGKSTDEQIAAQREFFENF